jgi:hypothetical protein
MDFVEDNDALRLKIVSSRKGPVQEVMVDGHMTEVQEDVNLVPSMLYPRHNH